MERKIRLAEPLGFLSGRGATEYFPGKLYISRLSKKFPELVCPFIKAGIACSFVQLQKAKTVSAVVGVAAVRNKCRKSPALGRYRKREMSSGKTINNLQRQPRNRMSDGRSAWHELPAWIKALLASGKSLEDAKA